MLDVPKASNAKIHGDAWFFLSLILTINWLGAGVVFGIITLRSILFGYVLASILIGNVLTGVVRGLILPWIHRCTIIFQSLVSSIDVSFVLLGFVMVDCIIFGGVLGNI